MTRGENAYKEAKTAGMVVRAGGDRECGKASGPGRRIHLSRVESGRVETEEPRLVSRAQLQCNVSIQLVHLHIDDVKMKDTKTEGMEVDIAETERRRRATWRSQRTRVTGRATTRMMTSSKLTLEIKHL